MACLAVCSCLIAVPLHMLWWLLLVVATMVPGHTEASLLQGSLALSPLDRWLYLNLEALQAEEGDGGIRAEALQVGMDLHSTSCRICSRSLLLYKLVCQHSTC